MWMLSLYLHVNQKSDDDDDSEGEKAPLVWTWNASMVQSRQPVQVDGKSGPGRPKMTDRDAESGNMAIDPHDRNTWRSGVPCVQQASYLEGGPLMWTLPLYWQKSDGDDDDDNCLNISYIYFPANGVDSDQNVP